MATLLFEMPGDMHRVIEEMESSELPFCHLTNIATTPTSLCDAIESKTAMVLRRETETTNYSD